MAVVTESTQLITSAKKILQLANEQGATEAEVSVSTETGFDISVRDSDLETLEHHQSCAAAITVFVGKRKGSASCSSFDPQALEQAVAKALTFAKYTADDPASGLPDPSSYDYQQTPIELASDWQIALDTATQEALDCEKQILATDSRIKQVEGVNVYSYASQSVLANSHGFLGEQAKTLHGKTCSVIAADDNGMQRDHAWTCARRATDLTTWDELAHTAAKHTLDRLSPKKLGTRDCPVLFSPEIARTLIGHFFNAIDGSAVYRKTSFLSGALGEQIFPEHISLQQRPYLPYAMGSSAFDGEGLATQRQHYIKDGKLERYCLDTYAARQLGLDSTANAGGIYNIFVQSPEVSFTQLLQQMDTGLLVTELMGSSVNLLTGHYSRGASGFWIEKGEIQYPVSEITIAGKLQDMFKNIVGVASDVDTRRSICTGSMLISQMMVAGQ